MSASTSEFDPSPVKHSPTDCTPGSPVMSFDSVTSDVNRLAKCKNLTMFDKELAANKLPQWMFITPNMS